MIIITDDSCPYRNPTHSERPSFSKISETLNMSRDTLLEWTRDGGTSELGGELYEAKNLYRDLQNTYLQR